MAFHEVRFPELITYGSSGGGPEFLTEVQATDSGGEQRIAKWAVARYSYQVGLDADQEQAKEIYAFFLARRGKLHGFRFKDWLDYKDEGRGIIVAVSGGLQLAKTYGDIAGTYIRRIQKPVAGTVQFYVGNTLQGGVTVSSTTGMVTGGSVNMTWRGEFDVPVRFDTDKCNMNIEDFDSRTWSGLPIIELLPGS